MAATSIDFFKPLDGESVHEATEVESYCVNCEKNGTTKLLLTKIPYYKEVILSSFSCPHCNYSNCEIQSAGELQREGIEYKVAVKSLEDLNRQVVKSDYAAISIPELELEIPAKSQKGEITTIEGIIARIMTGLEQDQPQRKLEHPEDYAKINEFLSKLSSCREAKTPFSMQLRDISGNSFVSSCSSTLPGQKDENLHVVRFARSKEEDHEIGFYSELELQTIPDENEETEEAPGKDADLHDEVLEFQTNCPNCSARCVTKMKLTKIPHFKEVVIMATDCDSCGSRTNEVKSGSGIEPKGLKISLEVTCVDDLSRDVLKSDTCSIEIPELEMEIGSGILGGKFTTVEGLLGNIKDEISQENPLISGDSADTTIKEKMVQFCKRFDKFIACDAPFTLILDDPAGNSYLLNVYAPEDDPHMKIERYERTFEQNEELGLNDMIVESQELKS